MALQPIRFQSAEEINKFLIRLQDMGLLTVKDSAIVINALDALQLRKQFLTASDGNLYFINDVAEYLEIASEQELQDVQVSFFIKNQAVPGFLEFHPDESVKALCTPKKPLTLAQMKEKPHIVNQLNTALEIPPFLDALNPQYYSADFLPKFENTEQLLNAKIALTNAKLKNCIDKFHEAQELQNKFKIDNAEHLVPYPLSMLQSFDYMSKMQKDIYKTTLFQQLRLKFHLTDAMRASKNPEEKVILKQWITELKEDIEANKQLLRSVADAANKHTIQTKEILSKYRALLSEDPQLEGLKARIEAKKAEAQGQNESYISWRQLFAILSPLAKYSALITIFSAIFSLAAFIPVALAPVLAFSPLLYLGLMSLITIGWVLAAYPIANAVISFTNMLEDKFDSVLTEKNNLSFKLARDAVILNVELQIAENYSQQDLESMVDVDHHELISELEADLAAVNEMDEQETIKRFHPLPEPSNVSSSGMFATLSRSRSFSQLPESKPASEKPSLIRSNSFCL